MVESGINPIAIILLHLPSSGFFNLKSTTNNIKRTMKVSNVGKKTLLTKNLIMPPDLLG